MKKSVIALVLVFVMFVMVVPASASWVWSMNVEKVQQASNGCWFTFTLDGNPTKFFWEVEEAKANQLMALAISAISLDKKVHVEITGGKVSGIALSNE